MAALCKTGELIFKTYKKQLLTTATNNAINFLILKEPSRINTKIYFSRIKSHILNQFPIHNHLL